MIIACDLHGEFIVFEDLDWDQFVRAQRSLAYHVAFAIEVPVALRNLGGFIVERMKVQKNRLPFLLKTSRHQGLENNILTDEMKEKIGLFNIERHSGQGEGRRG